jgi:hypothetical protein
MALSSLVSACCLTQEGIELIKEVRRGLGLEVRVLMALSSLVSAYCLTQEGQRYYGMLYDNMA